MASKYKRCLQRRHDCFAIDGKGYCHCLNDTNFKKNGITYRCPFYKPQTETAFDIEEIDKLEKEVDDDED